MADETAIPVRVGHYELVRTIGKGNFAVVKLGRHQITNSKVAVKVISTRALDADQLRKLHREIDIMKRVGCHEHVLRLYQVMQSERHVMLVTEFCAGGEIFDQLVANGRMSEPVARDYFLQIVAAVDFLHANGIVHRDLKAENLLLSADLKVVKLADFGFSNYYSRDALLSTWCGSPPYAAPELFEGRHYCGPKADIWSLGVVLYVLVCGALPFDGHTLQSLKSRVLNGKFRIPYFMSCDCEHLIRHMLVTDPDKRFALNQIKLHKWMRHLNAPLNTPAPAPAPSPTCIHCEQTQTTTLSDPIDMSVVDWVSRELNVDSIEILESVRSRAYDHNYALYHLVNDSSHATPSSAPPSPPLLPSNFNIIPSTNQRKSSITTGVVERDTPTTPLLSAVASPLRRHTFGPDTNSTSSQTQLVTPPLLFLTPPTVQPPIANLPLAPPNYPINNMDLLRPPNVLLMVNNNMGRRASDGQANYARVESSQQAVTCSASAFSFPPSQQTSPPIGHQRRKRHSLTDTNDLVSRQRRSGLSNIASPSNERCRRRASDGSNVVTSRQQISISSLQTELRALCVSSPPSLQTSPIHCASPTTPTAIAPSSLPPSSPPPTLPLISEECNVQSGPASNPASNSASISASTSIAWNGLAEELQSQCAMTSSGAVTCSPVPLLTPPQSFRSSPVTSPLAPSIAITDELGTLFPILPPPVDFQHVTSHPNLERGATAAAALEEELTLSRLHRWRNEESRRLQFATNRELRQTYPPSQHNHNPSQQHYTSLRNVNSGPGVNSSARALVSNITQCLSRDGANSQLTTTGSGSICIEDSVATKLLHRLAGKTTQTTTEGAKTAEGRVMDVIMFDDTDIQISVEWNALKRQLVLRRVSGDATQYTHVCKQLISSVM